MLSRGGENMYYLLFEATVEEVPPLLPAQAMEAEVCTVLVKKHTIPEELTQLNFQVDARSLERDWIRVNNILGGKLCSARFLEIASRALVSFTAFPAHLFDATTGELLATTFSFWAPSEVEDVIDWDRSEVWTNPVTGMRSLTKLVVSQAIEQAALPLFKLKGRGRILVHEKLRAQLLEAGITGIAFAPLDTIFMPQRGRQKPDLERQLQEHPEDWKAWLALSNLLSICHRYHEALEAIDRVLSLKADEAKVWHARGNVLEKLGQLREALDAYQRGVQLNPHSLVLATYSRILRELGYKQEALTVAEQFVRERGEMVPAWQELGNAYAELGYDNEALNAFERALSLGGLFFHGIESLYQVQGDVLSHLGRYEEALQSYDAGLHTNVSDQSLWRKKARVLHTLGREAEAMVASQEEREQEQRREENLSKIPL
jgi:tetratricopeptide (TPR) repeat protein